jgi:hypothetical protein
MFKNQSVLKFCNLAVAILIASVALVACGGGGGAGTGTTTASPTTKPPGVTYNAFTEDRVSEASVTFDIDGGISDGTTTYTLASTANGGCSFTSNPNDPSTPLCNPLPTSAGYLFCSNPTGEAFDTLLFRQSVVDASLNEIGLLQLSSISCGSTNVRTITGTIGFDSIGNLTETYPGAGSFSYAPSTIASIFATNGYIDAARGFFRTRFVLKKMVQTNKTTYFLLRLTENPGTNGQIIPARLFTLDVPR